ncbi:MAG: hypothetical protein J6Z02_10945 [Lachnospiraceae bacterium]|nr:hypothetical protein [Lachnospiraceae bacterium]
MKQEKRTLPPFDGQPLSSEDMYTHLPYVKDITLCTPETIRMVSGNVIKYYTIESADTITIDSSAESDRLTQKSHDDIARKYAEALAKSADAEEAIEGMTDQVEDMAAKLVADTSEDISNSNAEDEAVEVSAAPEGEEIANAFEGYNEDEEDEYDFSFLK